MSKLGSSVKIEDLFWLSDRRSFAAKPEMDPLTEADALMESQLLDIRFEVATSTLGLLFDLRQAIQLRSANTGLLLVRDVDHLEWEERFGEAEHDLIGLRHIPQLHIAWNVIASILRPTDLFSVELVFVPGAHLNVSGSSAEFFLGDVPGIGEVAASYTDDPIEVIEASLPHWDSPFDILYATFLDRKEP